MNDTNLDAKLKAAREPARPKEYQADFTQAVLKILRSSPRETAREEKGKARQPWLPRLAWGMATAACILIAFAIGHWRGQTESKAGKDVLANTEFIQETLAMFPNRVRAIVQDERGMNMVLSDKEDVPATTPIYVRICDGQKCLSLVTFSGQEIQIAGQKMTVLAQSDGGVILDGGHFAWSSGGPAYAAKGLKIDAKNLKLAAM